MSKTFKQRYSGGKDEASLPKQSNVWIDRLFRAPQTSHSAPCTLGQIAAYYIKNESGLTEREKKAWKYMQKLHGEEKLWKAYEDFVNLDSE
jgi:hypothetical protein